MIAPLHEVLMTIVLGVHLLAMNMACAGPILCIGLHGRESDDLELRKTLGLSLAWLTAASLLLGIFTGLALLLLGPVSTYTPALQRFPPRAYWFAGAELVFSLVCLLLYASRFKAMWNRRWLHALIGLLSSTNLLYHFPPLMGVIGKLIADPSWASGKTIQRSALLQLMLNTEILALTTHFALASLAVAGVALLWILVPRTIVTVDQPVRRIARGAAIVALISTLMQLPVGIWLTTTLPPLSRGALLGDEVFSSLLFLCGILTTFYLLQQLGIVALGEFQHRHLVRTCWLLVALVLLMTAVARNSRSSLSALDKSREQRKKALEHFAEGGLVNGPGSSVLLLPPPRGGVERPRFIGRAAFNSPKLLRTNHIVMLTSS